MNNSGVNSQSGIMIASSDSLKCIKSIFLQSNFQNYDKKGIGGHFYIKSKNIEIIET